MYDYACDKYTDGYYKGLEDGKKVDEGGIEKRAQQLAAALSNVTGCPRCSGPCSDTDRNRWLDCDWCRAYDHLVAALDTFLGLPLE